jgi:MATE family multidrug resistance protein
MTNDASPSVQQEVSHRRILKIAIPIVLANITVPLLGAVDTGVVGQLPAAAPIGAVGIGAIIITAIYWIFGFLRMGTTGLTSQALGRNDTPEAIALLSRALMIGLAGGAVMIAIHAPLFWASFQVAPASAEVETLATEYLQIRVFSAPAAIALFGVTGWMIAYERTTSVLLLQLWMNGINIILDVVFVLHFDFGVAGVAWATFIAEWSGLAFGLWLCRSAFRTPHWRDINRVFDRAVLKAMAVVNRDILLRSILLEAAVVSFLFLGSGIDDVTLAANQILLQFLHIIAYGLDGFAFSAEVLVGRALGAGTRGQLRQSAIRTSQWGVVIVVVLAGFFALAGPTIISVMTTEPNVRLAAQNYLFWIVLAPIFGVAGWMFDGIFIGATHTRDMRDAMFVSFSIYCVALVILLPNFGNHGLWASLLILYVARGVTLWLRYPKIEKAADRVA